MIAKFCAFIMAIAALFASYTPFDNPGATPVEDKDDFTPILRFVVSSDSHVEKFGDDGSLKIAKMLNTGYAAGEADADYKNLDAAIVVGDVTNSGLPSQFAAVNETVKNYLRDGTDFLAIAAKAHDSYGGRISRSYMQAISGDKADFHKVINGIHFIGISAGPTSAVHYTKKQVKWLDEQLAAATADDPTKPVFMFQHEHVYDTVYGSLPGDGWGVEFFSDILAKYPQVIHISGHSHYPANDPRAIWQDGFTAINDGGLSYYEFTIDSDRTQHPESSDNMAHMLLIEVDADNRVLVRVCDMTADKVMTEYLLEDFENPVKTKYSFEERKAAASAPVFNTAPEVSVNGKNVKLTVAPATPSENDVVFVYRVKVLDAAGTQVASKRMLGDYYKTLDAQNRVFNFELTAGDYTAVVTAEDAWGISSEAVNVNFTVK